MSEAEKVRQKRKEGGSIDEICEAVNLARHEVLRICRLAGMGATKEEKAAAKKRQAEQFAHSEQWAAEYIRNKTGGRYLYICGYKNMDQPVTVYEVRTGRIIEKSMRTFRSRAESKLRRRKQWGHIKIIDKDITLQKLYDRDEGRCHICGKLCDYNDITEEAGRELYGSNYPSIDHVVPISRGGEHSWENVRLAHLKCNIKKRNL